MTTVCEFVQEAKTERRIVPGDKKGLLSFESLGAERLWIRFRLDVKLKDIAWSFSTRLKVTYDHFFLLPPLYRLSCDENLVKFTRYQSTSGILT